jgi:hypothetical protein
MRVILTTNLIQDGQLIPRGTVLDVDLIIGPEMERVIEADEIEAPQPINEIITEVVPVEARPAPIKYQMKKEVTKKGGRRNGRSAKN